VPLVVLVGLGSYVLQQDRAVVTEEARQRADEIARDLAERLGREIGRELLIFQIIGTTWAGDRVPLPGRSPVDALVSETYRERLGEWQRRYPELRPQDVFPVGVLLSESGDLHSPKDYPLPPTPAPWLAQLSTEQQLLWLNANQALTGTSDTNAIGSAFQEFLDSDPPSSVRAHAEWMLLSLGLQQQSPSERVSRLIRFASRADADLSEGGLPMPALALARALREAAHLGLSQDLFDAANEYLFTRHPSFLSAQLLTEMERLAESQSSAMQEATKAVRLRWESQERLRALARRIQALLRPTNVVSTNLWFEWSDQHWFAILNPTESHLKTSENGPSGPITNRFTHIRLLPEAVIRRFAQLAVSEAGVKIPPYLGTRLFLEGQEIAGAVTNISANQTVLARSEGQLSQPQVLSIGSSAEGKADSLVEFEPLPSRPRLEIHICLSNPALLYAQARRRTQVFGLLLFAAAAAALLGLAKTFQALIRQQRLNEMKSNFVSSVSHELRAPIASVRLMAEGLESGRVKDDTKRAEYFKFIVQECQRLTSLIENVLDFSRIEQGRKQYDFAPTDIVALVNQTVKVMRTYAEEKQVKLVAGVANFQSSTCGLQLLADARALQQALINLIDNAIKHSPPGSTIGVGLGVIERAEAARRLAASAMHEPRTANHAPRLHLWVEDHGEGIPSHEHERIFERFYRCGSELRRETQGVGIGLSIVKHIIEAHGGRVLVRSAAGEGSRFTIELPLTEECSK